ncbi:MAG: peptide-methionine (R)-S-oxide reductase, partial [Phenylobacterium sp.]|nr:peptide-methionine (R)-S-oxide reductase [Phenylobacterium sp.]
MTLFQALHRRAVLLGASALAACGGAPQAKTADAYASSPWRKLSDAEWRQRLSPAAHQVLRHEGTERAGTSPLDKETRRGTYVCAGCELPLFKSDWKYD